MFVLVHGAYQVYQFFVHTRFIPALGPLERLLATPVLHRVHHGRDADCLDRNYGGFFIFWDKLFGSFAPYTRENVPELLPPLSNAPAARDRIVFERGVLTIPE